MQVDKEVFKVVFKVFLFWMNVGFDQDGVKIFVQRCYDFIHTVV